MKKNLIISLFFIIPFQIVFSQKTVTVSDSIDWEAESAFVDNNVKHAEIQYKYLISKMTRTDRYPRTVNNGNLEVTSGDAWTNGFFAGSLWYLYEYSKDDYWKIQAKAWTESLEGDSYTANSHDIGFILFCSFGNGYRLEPQENSNYKNIIIRGSNALSNRFNSIVQCIKSWDWYSNQCPVIIDNMMNLEMLMWASKATDNLDEAQKFMSIGTQHADKTMVNHLRDDYSSYHLVEYNATTGNVIKRVTYQGWSDNSMWARGQGWGIYGFTMMYRETGDGKYLETAKKMADVYLNHPRLPEDKIPWWDFNAGQPGYVKAFSRNDFTTVEYRDASAGAIVASALFELYTFTDNAQYLNAAIDMLHSLASDEYLAEENTNQGFLLKHCVGNFPGGTEIDAPLVYADYYFLEALLRYQTIIKVALGDGAGIKETPLHPITVFPNPADGIFTIQVEALPAHYDIYSIAGTLLNSGNLSQHSNIIDMTELNQGIYLLKTQTGNNIYSNKIVIK